MEPVIVEGKSVQEAIDTGLAQLKVSRDEVEIEILDEGSKGFLGFNAKNARVRITVKHSGPGKHQEQPLSQEQPAQQQEEILPQDMEDPESKVKEVLEKIVKTMDIPYTLEIDREGKQIRVYIKSPEEGLIIGKRGRNIDAIQHLVNRVMNRGPGEAKYKVIVDTNGRYREKKEKTLQEMVRKLSRRVIEKQKPITIIPLNPYERRIVHIAARDDKAVDVESIGDGFYKKMIFKKRAKR